MSAIVIQNCFKLFLSIKRYRKQLSAQQKIGAIWKGYKAQTEFKEAMNGIILIQKIWKGLLLKREYQNIRKAIICFQKNLRRKIVRRRYLALVRNIPHLQAIVRKICRQHILEREIKAEIVLSSVYKGKCARELHLIKHINAIKIQNVSRVVMNKVAYNNKKRAILIIQTAVRKFLKRKRLKEKRHATVEIQRVVRGYLSRKRSTKRQDAAIFIQKMWRMYHTQLVQKRLRKT